MEAMHNSGSNVPKARKVGTSEWLQLANASTMPANSAAAAAAAANAAIAQASNGVDLSVNVAPQPADDASAVSMGADSISSMDPSSKPFVATGDASKDVLPVDPSGNSAVSASQLLPSSWRQSSGDAQASSARSCASPGNWSAFAPTKAGFDKFKYASRHATMGINTRQPNPTGGIRQDSIRPPPSVALSGESIPFGDSSYRNDFLSIASQNMITKASNNNF
jgi:hypothetical protein